MTTQPTQQSEDAGAAGYKAFFQGTKYTGNPYADPDLAYAWSKGWLAAEGDCNRDSMRYEQRE